MKPANVYKARGRHFSYTLMVLVFVTIFFWSLERKPFHTALLSTQHQFSQPILDVLAETSQAMYRPKQYVLENEHQLEVDSTDDIVTEAENRQHAYHTDNIASEVEDDRLLTSSLEKKGCNYANGRWIRNDRRPLYSGFQCKKWLSDMWACRLMQRPDFSYESYRWQPESCDMPDFVASEFLERMQDKTIAFVGDSLGRQQFQSLMCMLTGGEDSPEIDNVGSEYGFVARPGVARPDGWAFRFPETNTTVVYYWSSCLCCLQPLNSTDPDSKVAMHLDQLPAFLKKYLGHLDVLVLNTGHHWNRGKINANRWVMHVDGMPLVDRKLAMVGNAKNLTVHNVVRWLDSQLPNHPRLKVFFRTISPRHFVDGDWNTGGSCENLTPLTQGSEVREDGSRDSVVSHAVMGTGINLLDITALSQLRDEGHISRYAIKGARAIQDCLHWCLPGIPDTWNEILAAQV